MSEETVFDRRICSLLSLQKTNLVSQLGLAAWVLCCLLFVSPLTPESGPLPSASKDGSRMIDLDPISPGNAKIYLRLSWDGAIGEGLDRRLHFYNKAELFNDAGHSIVNGWEGDSAIRFAHWIGRCRSPPPCGASAKDLSSACPFHQGETSATSVTICAERNDRILSFPNLSINLSPTQSLLFSRAFVFWFAL